MLKVDKQEKGDVIVLTFNGTIEEDTDLSSLVGSPTQLKWDIYLKGVQRINSMGVKTWVKFFQAVASKGIQIKYLECSTAIVEQMNLLKNFGCGGTVVSMYLPYRCSKCSKELFTLFRVEDLQKLSFEVPPVQCPQCKSPANFDDLPEEYFGFLQRS